MGKGIVYCQDCGKSLREDMFSRGQAHTVDDRPYCSACRAPDPTPPTGAYPKAVKRRPSQVLPAVPQARTNPHLPILIGGALAAVGFIVLLVVLLSGGQEAPPEAPPEAPVARKDPAAEAFEPLRRFATDAQDPDAILLRCDETREKVRGTPYQARLEAIEKRAIERKAGRQRSDQLDAFLRQIRSLADDDRDFRKRVEVEGMLDSARKIAGAREPEVDALRAELRGRFEAAARKALGEAKARVAKLRGEEKFADALAAIDQVPAAFLATGEGAPLAALRPEVEAKAEEQEKLARVWLEGEDLKVLQSSGAVQPQDLKSFPGFSNGVHLWWREAKPGAVLRLEFPSKVAGRRKLALALTKAPDYGIVRLSVNGAVVAESVDLFHASGVTPSGELPFEIDLRKGPNELKVEITGSNPAAKPANHMFGIDYLRIE